jgi:hypothetical protein
VSSRVALKSVQSIVGYPLCEYCTKGWKDGYKEAKWAKSDEELKNWSCDWTVVDGGELELKKK